MRRGRAEEASALAQRIGKEITQRTKTQLKSIQGNVDCKKIWACVCRLTGKKPHDDHVEGISAESLYNHYSKMSTDPKYVAQLLNLTVGNSDKVYIDEYKIFGVWSWSYSNRTRRSSSMVSQDRCTHILPASF